MINNQEKGKYQSSCDSIGAAILPFAFETFESDDVLCGDSTAHSMETQTLQGMSPSLCMLNSGSRFILEKILPFLNESIHCSQVLNIGKAQISHVQ